MKKIKIKNLKEMDNFSDFFLKNIKEQRIFLLNGDLGSGKTTFVKSIAKKLNILDDILSPTFVILKKYSIPKNNFSDKKKLIHIDAYRLKNSGDIKNIGLSLELAKKNNLIFIEWASIIDCAILKNATKLTFKYLSEHEREIELILP